MTIDQRTFPEFVAERFGGTLSKGAHNPDGKACVNEALNGTRADAATP